MRERNKLEQSNVVMAGRVKGERERKRETERVFFLAWREG